MNSIFKTLFGSPAALLALLPFILTTIGESAKNRDDNSVGTDDAFGNLLIAIAPASSAFQSKDDLKMDAALLNIEETVRRYRLSRQPNGAPSNN